MHRKRHWSRATGFFPSFAGCRARVNTYYFSSSFSLSPTGHARACARARVYARGRGERGKKVKDGSFLAEIGRRGRREQPPIHTEFVALSGPVLGGHTACHVGPWAKEGRRSVPDHPSDAPFATGGVSGRWVANPRAKVGPVGG